MVISHYVSYIIQVESETAMSELKLSNTTGRLVQLEREVGLLRQNNLEVNRLAETANWTTDQAKQSADEAEQVYDDITYCLLVLTQNLKVLLSKEGALSL